jgi:sulfite reductase (NADPH) hemoprotein beta-component
VRLARPARALAGGARAGLATPNHRPADRHHLLPGRRLLLARQREVDPHRRGRPARFDDLDYLHDIGELDLNISGCMNSCGHHHVGHIGILGVDKDGEEWYQVSIGGAADAMPEVIARLIETYLELRTDGERFIDVVERTGIAPFKTHVYATPVAAAQRAEEAVDA